MRTILEVLGISKEDLERFSQSKNRRYRSFLKKWNTLQRINKHKRDLPGLYYNIAYWWTSKELHREYNCIIDKWEEEAFRKNIIRVEYVSKAWTKEKKSVYIDAREIMKILQDMWYDVKPNKNFYKFIDKKCDTTE